MELNLSESERKELDLMYKQIACTHKNDENVLLWCLDEENSCIRCPLCRARLHVDINATVPEGLMRRAIGQ